MAGIASDPQAGSTVIYNGVQFGGSDAPYASLPPEYELQGVHVYDQSNRAVIGVDYTLTVKCTFYGDTEAAMSASAEAIRERLSEPGKVLRLPGLGIGFSTVTDLNYGPKPISFNWKPWGQGAWECVWIVQFRVSECLSGAADPLAFVAFNYETTWQNDFEGQCTRTISGYAEIAGQVDNRHVADEVRERIKIITPAQFNRIDNVWKESADKTRLDFVVVDQQIGGDPFPSGITVASGYCDFESVGPGFAKGQASIGMTLKTAPGVPKGLAGTLFIQAVLAKQTEMSRRNQGGTVIPHSIRIRNEKYEDARVTSCSASWMLTKCLNQMLNAVGIWEPLTPGNYQQWRTSVERLWDNRGNAGLRSIASDDVILDVCDSVTQRTIGNTPSNPPYQEATGQFRLQCPDIPPDGGWMVYDFRSYLYRKDNQKLHRKAIEYIQSVIPSSPGDIISAGGGAELGDPVYEQYDEQQHVTEYNGYPTLRLITMFKLLRFRHDPPPPVIKSVGGRPVTLIESSNEQSRVAFDVFECPVFYRAGYRIYQVNGPVRFMFPQGRKDSCAKPGVIENY